jgi:DNA-binding beta-propeller fold protein YncE
LGGHGKGDNQFDHPSSVAVDSDGEIYVCDWANNRVQTFDKDRNYLTTFEGNAQELSKWQRQYVNANPDVYKARRRVYTLEPEQRFALPMAVAFDNEKSRLMVVDAQRWRIQIYNKLRNYADPQFNI